MKKKKALSFKDKLKTKSGMRGGGLNPSSFFLLKNIKLQSGENLSDKSNTINSRLDTVFSLYIRLKDTDNQGFTKCITCGKKIHYKNIHCGHYISRQNLTTRWNEKNCNPQCAYCNVNLAGNIEIYKNKLGDECVKYLLNLREIPTRKWIEENIEHYERKVKLLVRNLH